jgi:hypothetical protein
MASKPAIKVRKEREIFKNNLPECLPYLSSVFAWLRTIAI